MNLQTCARVIRQILVAWMISIGFLSPIGVANEIRVQANQQYPLLSQLRMPTYVWSQPQCQPQAIIVGFHGGCLHGRSFDSLANKLMNNDLMFVSFDMRGYGKWHHSGFGSDEDRTFNYRKTFADVRLLLTELRGRYPGVPIYCLGESLGANAAVLVAKEMSDLADGAILVSPAFGPRLFITPQMVRDIAHAIVMPRSPLDMAPYLRKRLASNPNIVLEHLQDPLRRDLQTPKELWQSLTVNYRGRKYATQLCPHIALLVIHGTKDKLCSARATERRFAEIPIPNKHLVLLDDTGHLIVETSLIDDRVIGTLCQWINNQVGMRAAMNPNHRIHFNCARPAPRG